MTDRINKADIVNDAGRETGVLNGQTANLALGGETASGDIILRDEVGKDTVHLDGGDANLRLGGHGIMPISVCILMMANFASTLMAAKPISMQAVKGLAAT